jgi:hypothetical protein
LLIKLLADSDITATLVLHAKLPILTRTKRQAVVATDAPNTDIVPVRTHCANLSSVKTLEVSHQHPESSQRTCTYMYMHSSHSVCNTATADGISYSRSSNSLRRRNKNSRRTRSPISKSLVFVLAIIRDIYLQFLVKLKKMKPFFTAHALFL